jgi:hypothetical protein
MNKELLEELSVIREYLEDLVAVSALVQAGDVKKLAELVKQKDGSFMRRDWKVVKVFLTGEMWDNYRELFPYMTVEQGSRAANGVAVFNALADVYLGRDIDHHFTDAETKHVPLMLADLDVLAEKLSKTASELLEKVSAIREDLLAWNAHVTDLKKLAELVMQKVRKEPSMGSNYWELWPYMTRDQKKRSGYLGGFETAAETYLAIQKCPEPERENDNFLRAGRDYLTRMTTFLPLMLADLDDIAKKLENNA